MTPSRTPPSEPGDYVFTPDKPTAAFPKPTRIAVNHEGMCRWRTDGVFLGEWKGFIAPGWWQREHDPQGYVPPPLPKVEVAEGIGPGDKPCRVLLINGQPWAVEDDEDCWCEMVMGMVRNITNRRMYREPEA